MIQDEPKTEKEMLAEIKEAVKNGIEYVSEFGHTVKIKGAYVIHAEKRSVVFFYDTRNDELNALIWEHFFDTFKRVEK